MGTYEAVNKILVDLFHEIQEIEERAIITSDFKDISGNDMHILEAVGIKEARSMSAVAKDLSITVGTLTIAINNLVKKGYVVRQRSETDRRVVLISLSPKGKKAFYHHKQFHDQMVQAVLENLNEEEERSLTAALNKLHKFFRQYGEEPVKS